MKEVSNRFDSDLSHHFWGTGLHAVVASLAMRIFSGVGFPGAPPRLSSHGPRTERAARLATGPPICGLNKSGLCDGLKSRKARFDSANPHHQGIV